MSNGSISEHPKRHKHFIIDYRNAKYQGSISSYDRIPTGIGTLLNIDYLLVLAKWNQGIVQGQCMVVYPQGNIFYGTLNQSVPVGFTSYQISEHKMLYCFIAEDRESIVVVDCQLSKRLSFGKIRPSQLKKLLSEGERLQKRDKSSVFQDGEDFERNNISIYQESKYEKQEDKWELIEQIIGTPVQPHSKDIKCFIKYHFNTTVNPKDQRVELIQTKDYIELRNKKAGIVCRLNEHFQHSNRVRFIGYYDSYQGQCDYYRKSKTGFEQDIEQVCQSHTIAYHPLERPKTCKENLLNYHKKSVHFVNKFLPVKYLEHVQYCYKKIYQAIASELSLRDAQTQLECGLDTYRHEPPEKTDEKAVGGKQFIHQYELSQIQNDIYERVSRRKQEHHNRLSSLSRLKTENSHPPRLIDSYQRKSEFKENFQKQLPRVSSSYFNEEASIKNQKQYLKYTEASTPVNRIRNLQDSSSKVRKRRYQYITTDEPYYDQISMTKKSPKEYTTKYNNPDTAKVHSKDQVSRNYRKTGEKYRDQTTRYQYQEESIGDLASNYKQINSQLQASSKKRSKGIRDEQHRSPSPRVATPGARSPTKYGYTRVQQVWGVGGESKSKRSWR